MSKVVPYVLGLLLLAAAFCNVPLSLYSLGVEDWANVGRLPFYFKQLNLIDRIWHGLLFLSGLFLLNPRKLSWFFALGLVALSFPLSVYNWYSSDYPSTYLLFCLGSSVAFGVILFFFRFPYIEQRSSFFKDYQRKEYESYAEIEGFDRQLKIKNISKSGCWIETKGEKEHEVAYSFFKNQTKIQLRVVIENNELEFTGIVVRTNQDGFGVRFSADSRSRIAHVIACIIFLSLSCFSETLMAQNSDFQVFASEAGNKLRPVLWKNRVAQGFKRGDGGETVYRIQMLVDLPRGNWSSDDTSITVKNNRALISIDQFEKVWSLNFDGQPWKIQIRHRLSKKIVDQTCKQQLLDVEAAANLPFYFAVHCRTEGEQTYLTVTVPLEADLIETPISERGGKGENWKLFEIGNVQSAAGRIVTFTFEYDKKRFPLTLFSKRNPADKSITVFASLASSNSSIDSRDFQVADGKVSFILGVVSKPIWDAVRVGVELRSGLMSSDPDKNIDSTHYLVFGGYRFGSTYYLEPRFSFHNTNLQQASYFVRLNAPGGDVGLSLGYLGERVIAELSAYTTVIGAGDLKSFLDISAGIHYRLFDSSRFFIGLNHTTTNYEVQGSVGTQRKIGQSYTGATISFR